MTKHRIINGLSVPLTEEESKKLETEWETEKTKVELNRYKSNRRSEYPPIEEQLDMLYKDKLNNTEIWFETIKSIKDRNPKPEVK